MQEIRYLPDYLSFGQTSVILYSSVNVTVKIHDNLSMKYSLNIYNTYP